MKPYVKCSIDIFCVYCSVYLNDLRNPELMRTVKLCGDKVKLLEEKINEAIESLMEYYKKWIKWRNEAEELVKKVVEKWGGEYD